MKKREVSLSSFYNLLLATIPNDDKIENLLGNAQAIAINSSPINIEKQKLYSESIIRYLNIINCEGIEEFMISWH